MGYMVKLIDATDLIGLSLGIMHLLSYILKPYTYWQLNFEFEINQMSKIVSQM